MAYDAFISYSHAADGRLAPALQSGLQRLAKPWFRVRSLRVFRDETGLSTNPDLWSSIAEALDESEWFVLLASPEAAASPWVDRELAHWSATKSVSRILPVVTAGEWEWDAATGRLVGDAVPERFAGMIVEEPRHLDLRWAHGDAELDLRHSGFRSAIADLAAPMHGVAKDELEGEDVRQHRRARNLARVGVATVVALLIIAVAFGAFAVDQRRAADGERDRARAATVSAQAARVVAEVPQLLKTNRERSALLALQAYRLRPDGATRSALLTAALDSPELSTSMHSHRHYRWVAFLPDGVRVVAASSDGIDVWDTATGRRVGRSAIAGVEGMAVSPTDGTIAVSTGKRSIDLIDPATLRRRSTSIRFSEPTTDLAFAPDGATLAVAFGAFGVTAPATDSNRPRVVEVKTGRVVAELGGQAVASRAVAFDHRGTTVATSGPDGVVVLHDVATGAARGPVIDVGHSVGSLAFSDDDATLAAGVELANSNTESSASAVYLLDVATGAAQASTYRSSFGATYVRFAPRRPFLATANVGGDIKIYPTVGFGAPSRSFDTQHGYVTIAFNARGDLAAASTDGTVTVRRPFGAPSIARTIESSPPDGGVFNRDGSLMALSDINDRVSLYRVSDKRRIRVMSASSPGSRVARTGTTPAAFSPDGRWIAVGDRFGNVRVFAVASGRPMSPSISAARTPLTALAFSPDGRLLIATSNTDRVNGARAIDLATNTVTPLDPWIPTATVAAFAPAGTSVVVSAPESSRATVYPVVRGRVGRGRDVGGESTSAAAFRPDGERLVTGTLDGRITVRDARSFKAIGQSVNLGSAVLALTYSPDGRYLLAQDIFDNTSLIDLSASAVVGGPFPGNGDYGNASFSPDGRTVLLPGADSSVLLALDPNTWSTVICERVGRSITRAEWATYFAAAGDHRRTCGSTR